MLGTNLTSSSTKRFTTANVQNFAKFSLLPSVGLHSVFRLDSTLFILQVEQHKLDSCSMGCLSKTLQGRCYIYLDFLFSKYLEQFSKNFNSRTESGKDIQFAPKCSEYNVAFVVKKLKALVVWFVKYDKFKKCQKDLKILKIFVHNFLKSSFKY